jgi:predicted RNA-binding protein with PUA-like domain
MKPDDNQQSVENSTAADAGNPPPLNAIPASDMPAKDFARLVAMQHLQRFFAAQADAANEPNAWEVSAQEIFRATGRQNFDARRNLTWLRNRIRQLRAYDFVLPVYSEEQPPRLVGVKLTAEGHKALHENVSNDDVLSARALQAKTRHEAALREKALREAPHNQPLEGAVSTTSGSSPKLQIPDLAKAVARFKKENPQYQVTFRVALRKTKTN